MLGLVANVITIKMRQLPLIRTNASAIIMSLFIRRNSTGSKMTLSWLLCDAWLNNYCLNLLRKSAIEKYAWFVHARHLESTLPGNHCFWLLQSVLQNSATLQVILPLQLAGNMYAVFLDGLMLPCHACLSLLHHASSLMISRWLTRCIRCWSSFDGAAASPSRTPCCDRRSKRQHVTYVVVHLKQEKKL